MSIIKRQNTNLNIVLLSLIMRKAEELTADTFLDTAPCEEPAAAGLAPLHSSNRRRRGPLYWEANMLKRAEKRSVLIVDDSSLNRAVLAKRWKFSRTAAIIFRRSFWISKCP